MKASAFRRWPVAGAYSPEQTTRLTGGSDLRVLCLVWSLGIHRSFFICIIKEKKRGEKDYLSISITHIDSMVFAYLV